MLGKPVQLTSPLYTQCEASATPECWATRTMRSPGQPLPLARTRVQCLSRRQFPAVPVLDIGEAIALV